MNEPSDPNATTPQQPVPPIPHPDAWPPGQPSLIGRYHVLGKLGSGVFGVVYRAHDEELRRPVAIKVPHRERVSRPEDVEAYLAEARVLASLDHLHIVPVFDVGQNADGLPFVVSKLIEGTDLKARVKAARPTAAESAGLVVAVAEALHHAHLKGVVHRDIKPANILLDKAGKPFVTDFGIALREEDFGKGPRFAGTPLYMSPEQARSEGDRVDGRSDIFSLGVVFYELLTGRRPFRGDTQAELLEQILRVEARPPRQVDDTVPRELERICLKALAKRATERFTTAKDFAEELTFFLRRPGRQGPAPVRAEPADAFTPSGGGGVATPALEIATGPMEGRTYELNKDRVVVGRSPDCDIVLYHPNVARYHCQLVRSGGGYLLEDLNTLNGTCVNGVGTRGRVPLHTDDRIHVGDFVLVYHEG
jgi:hypothetical protein